MTSDSFSVEVERRIKAPADKVFRYLTESELYVRWMGVRAEIDARPGGMFRIEVPGRSVAVGEYIVVEHPSLLVYTWGWENSDEVPPGSSTVEITLRCDGEETVVRLRHSGLPDDPMAGSHREGWTKYMDRLCRAVVGDNPGPDATSGDDDGR